MLVFHVRNLMFAYKVHHLKKFSLALASSRTSKENNLIKVNKKIEQNMKEMSYSRVAAKIMGSENLSNEPLHS